MEKKVSEREVANGVRSELESDGWVCTQDVASINKPGTDLIFQKDGKSYGIECKGNAGSDGLDTVNLIGQAAINVYEKDYDYNGIAAPPSYERYVTAHFPTLKAMNLYLFIADRNGVIALYTPDVME